MMKVHASKLRWASHKIQTVSWWKHKLVAIQCKAHDLECADELLAFASGEEANKTCNHGILVNCQCITSWQWRRQLLNIRWQCWLVLHTQTNRGIVIMAPLKATVLSKPHGPLRGADLHFRCPQLDTSLYCVTINTKLVHCLVYLSTSQLKLVLIYQPRREGRSSRPSWLVTYHDSFSRTRTVTNLHTHALQSG